MKKIIAMLCVLCLAFALCACGNSGGDGSKAPAGDSLTFTTGGDTGTYYGYGSVLAQYVSSNSDISVTAVVGNGSQANVEDLNSGAVQLGFCQSDVMSYAYTGTNLFAETGAVDSFSVVAALYMEQVQIVTMNADIKTVVDLKGKTVSIGVAGSGVYFNAIDVLGVYGMTEDDITPVYQNFSDSAESLKDGKMTPPLSWPAPPPPPSPTCPPAVRFTLSALTMSTLISSSPSLPTTAPTPFLLPLTACLRTARPSPSVLLSWPETMYPRTPFTLSSPPFLKTPAAFSTARPRS